MVPDDLIDHLQTRFAGLVVQRAFGEQTLYYNPGRCLKRGTYMATIKTANGPNDKASGLDRPDMWRFNFGLPPARFVQLFGPKPQRPPKGGIVSGDWDFKATDTLMPHPIYGWMGWVCILNPSETTLSARESDIALAHDKARRTFDKRLAKGV